MNCNLNTTFMLLRTGEWPSGGPFIVQEGTTLVRDVVIL
jgi:hypothetical protein